MGDDVNARDDQSIFRKEAMEAFEGREEEGALLEIAPRWTKWAYWLLIGVLTASLSYAAFGTLTEYASGPAIIRVDGRVDLTAAGSGSVVGIDVSPGQRVTRGQLLVHFYMAQEVAERDRLNQEFEMQLARLLRDLSDRAARESLTSLRAQRDLADARIAERSLRASVDGVVSDLRIRLGQFLSSGELVLSIIPGGSRFSVLALLPGQTRPLLKKGMPIRIVMSGFAYNHQELTIDSIGDEVVGPGEARRYIGPDLGDAFALAGPVTFVKARVPNTSFTSDGRSLEYYDGMPARAEAPIRKKSIAVMLVPALERLLGRSSG